MSSRRTQKVAEAIREVVSTTILFGLKDPRVKNVTVIRAEVSPDIRNAKVYVSVMGDEKVQSLTMKGLDSARGFLQSKVADRLQTRYTPILRFVLDPGVKLSAMTSAAIREVLGPDQVLGQVQAGDEAGAALADVEEEDQGQEHQDVSTDSEADDDADEESTDEEDTAEEDTD